LISTSAFFSFAAAYQIQIQMKGKAASLEKFKRKKTDHSSLIKGWNT